MKTAWIFGIGLGLGCVHSYQMDSGGSPAPSATLSPGVAIYVAAAADGGFGGRLYPGSGATTTREVTTALSAHTSRVRAAPSVASRQANLAAARQTAADYLLEPAIFHWEERATEWSGRPDRIGLRLDLIEVSSGRRIDSTVIAGKSRALSFGGDQPQHLLPVPLASYFSLLFSSDE